MRNLKQFFSYKKFTKPPYKILFLNKVYFLQNETIHCFKNMGHSVHVLNVPEDPKEMLDGLLKACVQFKPDFLMGMNYIGFDSDGKIANILNQLEIPVIFWYLDDHRFIIGESEKYAYSNIIIFTFEKNNIHQLKKFGYKNVYYLPTATVLNPNLRYFDSNYSFLSNAISFIGSTFEKTKQAWNRPGYHDILNGINFNEYFDGNYNTIIELIEMKQKQKFHTKSDLYHYAGYAAAAASQLYRVKYLSGINKKNIHIFGDETWKQLNANATVHNSVDNINTAPKIFSSSAINLNISSCQLETTVNLRLFDIPAANGFLLTDWKESIAELFDTDNEVVFYKSIDEMNDKIDFYIRNENLRKNIVQKAKQRILRDHLLIHRLEKILSFAKDNFG